MRPASPEGQEQGAERRWLPPMELDPVAARPVAVPEVTEGGAEPEPAAENEAVAMPEAARVWPVRWLVGGIAAVVAVGVGFDTADLLARAFSVSAALGLLVTAGLGAAGVATVAMLAREVRSLARLRRIERLRGEAARLGHAAPEGEGDRFAAALTTLYAGRADLQPALLRLGDLVTDAHDDAEVVRLIDREVLTVLDRRAYQLVVGAARETALATALSPAALLDVAIVLWRNLKLVRAVATLYGVRPGYVGSLRLLRRMLGNLAVAGVTESAHHVAVDALGGSLAAAISTRVGQGVINGLLTARIGLTAMHTCRPVPYSPETRPSLGRIRAELLSLPRQVL